MNKNQISIVLVGIGGYGNTYLNRLLNGQQQDAFIAGVVDIHPEKSDNYYRVIENHIPIFSSIEEFYETMHAELAIIATPIHLHTYQTCFALEQGSNVLCEKPMCATIEDARKMIETRDRTGKFLAIGFNWSFNPSVQKLKQDIMDGVFGKPKRLKTVLLWPRPISYYNRAPWAGRLRNEEGNLILDSVANNATAHYLHNMFYLLGSKIDKSAQLKQVTAKLYRANPIESFDTCAVKAKTDEDVDVLFYASHAVHDQIGPNFTFEFELATMSYTQEGLSNDIMVQFHDGRKRIYPSPQKEDPLQKLSTCISAIASNNHYILCGPEAAYAHTLSITNMHKSEIVSFPESLIVKDKEKDLIWVEGLTETLMDCYDKWCLPSET